MRQGRSPSRAPAIAVPLLATILLGAPALSQEGPSAAFSGRTLQARFTVEVDACSGGSCETRRGLQDIHVFVAPGGRLYDYGFGQRGAVFNLGEPRGYRGANAARMTFRGGRLVIDGAGDGGQSLQMVVTAGRGGRCRVEARYASQGRNAPARVTTEFCRLVAGHIER